MNILRISGIVEEKRLTITLTAVLLLSLLVFMPGAEASPAASQPFADAQAPGPNWIIEVWPQAECSGWWVDFEGSNSNGEAWRVKVDGNVIASGTTNGNETVSGTWPPTVDLSQSHTFRAEIYESGNWLNREDSFGPCGAGTCVTIQRGRNGSVADAYVWEASPNSNSGSSTSLYTGIVGGGRKRSLLQFDLSMIPSNASLTQATFTIDMQQGSGQTVNAHRITATWDESIVTWNNFNNQYDGAVQGAFTSSGAPTLKNIELLSLTQGWVDGSYSNDGLLLDNPANSGSEQYFSSEISGGGGLHRYRPKLEVCYQAPPPPPEDVCYGVADGYGSLNDSGAEDTLAFLNKLTGQTAPVGGVYPNTGTNNIEAIAFQPGGQTLYAADAGQLGTLNLSTGAFTALPQPFGTGDGSAGSITFSDVDGLSFDMTTGVLYGTHRRGGNDLLFQIDTTTGAHVPDAFGPGVDYVEIASGSTLPDTDDIASDPVSGIMYASINDGGSSANKLVILDTATGSVTEVGTIKDGSGTNVQDVEGLSFFNDGLLYGTTGKNGPTTNGLWRIDKNTAVATFVGNFSTPLKDFEGSDCLTASAFIVLDKEASVAEARVGDTITYSYTIKNTGGVVLDPVTLDDDRLGALLTAGDGVSLAPGASTLVSATYTVLAGDLPGPITNVAEATGIPPAGSPVTDTDTVTVELVAIDLVKEVSTSLADVGDTVTYTYTVTNTGSVTLSNITLNDDVLGPITLGSTTLAPGASTQGTAQHVVQLGDLPGPIVNLATVTGQSPGGLTVQDQDTQTVNLLARVSGHVWDDTASPNGQYDGDESPLASVPITLTDGANTWTTQTNGSGYYEFTGLMPDAYTIIEQDPSGYSSTGDVDPPNDNQIHVTLQSGDNVTGRDFFDATLGSIGDFVWRDLDVDGFQDPGEPGIDGVLVELLDDQGGLITTETTAGGGLYLFDNLAAGDYQVRIAASNFGPTGALFGFGHTSAATFGPNPQTITLAASQNYVLADFGYAKAGLDLLKSVSAHVVVSGTQVTYSYTFTNTGDTYLDNIVVTDNRLGQICPPPTIPTLGPGDSFTCTKTVELTESVCNVGTVTGRAVDSKGTPLDGFTTIVDQSDEVCVDVVDARLTLTPPQDANRVGDDHVLTATLEFDYGDGNGWVAAPAGETITFSIDSGPGSLSSSTCTTDANGQCNVTLTSTATGLTTVSASWSGTITTGLGSTTASASSNDAIKRWVDVELTLTPPEDANRVGDDHVLTATLKIDVGDGNGLQPADGETISFNLDSGPGNLSSNTCQTNANGQCNVTLTSNSSGLSQVSASWSGTIVTAEGSVSASTSDDAVKRWVDARLSLTPAEAANEIGDDHVFTATLEFDYGDGNGWVAAPAGETINFSIDSGPGSLSSNTCTTDANGQCNVTLSSSTPGTTQVSASWNGSVVTAEGSVITSTSDDAVKRWVDARISITPQQATNPVGESHTFTVTVEQHDGSGWGNAPDGTQVSFTLLNNTANAFFVGGVDTCTTTNGQCTVTINASQAGSVDVHASTTFDVQGVTLTRETDGQGGNSGDATKVYVGAKIGDYVWEDLDGDGVQNEPASAGINGVTVELYTSAGVFVADTVTANDGGGNPGYYLFENVAPGDYYVKFIKPAGYEFTFQDVDDGNPNPDERDSDPDPATGQTATFSVAGNDVDLTRDAGLYRPVTLGDQTFVDSSGDGQPTNGELLLSNVILEIDGPAGTFLVTTSGFGAIPDGNYLESGLHPGTYTVTVKSYPSGFVPTGPTQITHMLVSGETNLTFDFPFINTTGVAVMSLTAERRSSAVVLRWTTASEAGNDGFHVWRATAADGDYWRLTTELIASQAVGGAGASYEWVDSTAAAGQRYWYRLETAPEGQVIGPVAVRSLGRVFLPMMQRNR